MAQVKVVAVERGHDGRVIREVGDVFEVDEKRLKDGSTWFKRASKEDEGADKKDEEKLV